MTKSDLFAISKPILTALLGYGLIVIVLSMTVAQDAKAERIKDIAMVEGARTNQLIGFGLVVVPRSLKLFTHQKTRCQQNGNQ